MPTTAISLLFFFLLISSAGHHLAAGTPSLSPIRRILHQPLFPLDSSPPSSPSPPPPPPQQLPFFPANPSPPPSSSPFASFPANISSLTVPHSPSSKSSVSKKLVAVTVVLTLSAAVFAAVALYFYFRGHRRGASNSVNGDDKTSRSETTASNSVYRFNVPPPPPAPQLRKPSNNSSEFLYIGTLVNSGAIDGGNGVAGGGGGVLDSGGGRRGGRVRKMRSPDLYPLPPIVGRQQQQMQPPTQDDEDQEEFYSPRGSASGRESGSGSRRVFEAVVRAQQAQAEQLMDENGGRGNAHSDDSTSSSSSSSSGSPARSASISISPPVSNNSPKKHSNPKSSPEFIKVQPQPLPEMMSPPFSLSDSFSSTEEGMKTVKEEDNEAEESPLLFNASSSSRMSSPPQSPRLSPLTGKLTNVTHEERDWGVLGRSSPSLSTASTPTCKSSPISSLKLPAFLGGKKKHSNSISPPSTMVSNSPVSPHSPSSPISSNASSSHNTRSYPASPLSSRNSPRLSSVSDLNSPRLSNDSCRNSSRFSDASDHKNSLSTRTDTAAPPPPPPPPPPPTSRRSPSPQPPPPPPPSLVPKLVALEMPLKSILVEKQPAEASGSTESVGATSEETTPKPKLKPLHWDKVRASSDKEMVWDQLKSSSFKLNEEMIETLFVVKTPNPIQKEKPQRPVQHLAAGQENKVLDPKKAQNIAILLRALNVTMEEVCEALLEGNAESLGTELLENLLKMAPTKEEERKLKEHKDDSPVKLGQAEKFLKAVIDIPFAFKRVGAMLYVTNFESEVEYLKKSFETLEAACDELRSSRMFLKLLEAVLKTGNRMNVGTNRGDAHAFKLDTLLKLVDIKGADGKTTLLHFVVQEIIRTEGQRLTAANNQTPNDEAKIRRLGLQVVSTLGSELANVKKAAAMDSDVLSKEVAKLSAGLVHISELIRLNDEHPLQETYKNFSDSMNRFMKIAEEEIFRIQAQERLALSLVKEITEYFHGNSAKEEAHPFRIFMVVRDFLSILDRVCKEVGMINERSTVSSAHRFPVPVNPMLPVPVNPLLPQVLPSFPGRRGAGSSDDGSP